MGSSFEATIDLSGTQQRAELVRSILLKLRTDHNLAKYEYARRVRIAPGRIPHSHPVLTLNTFNTEPNALLGQYLHEQMHWYATWFSHAHAKGWQTIWAELKRRHPDNIPLGFPEGADNIFSTHLHLIVNWLEVEAVADCLGRPAAVAIASSTPVYKAIYRLVLDDWDALGDLYRQNKLAPIRAATSLSSSDLELAARMDEAASNGK